MGFITTSNLTGSSIWDKITNVGSNCYDSSNGRCVTYKNVEYCDSCVGTYLKETYCSNDQPASRTMRCSFGCSNGACLPASTKCGDGICNPSYENNYNCPTDCKSCNSECPGTGITQCNSANSYQVCGNYDSDTCLEWSSTKYCSSGYTCSNGQCIPPTPTCKSTGQTCSYNSQCCSNICTNAKCASSTTCKTCSQLGKNCGSWSNNCGGTIDCGTCSANYTCSNGQCVYSQIPPTCTPTWECTEWSVCSNGQKTRSCTDDKNCGTNTGKPAESQSCSTCTPGYKCYSAKYRGYQKENCSWAELKFCSQGCSNGACVY